MTGLTSCLYLGTVAHQRFRPKRHALRYRVFSALLDLDELAEMDARLRLFGYNRPAAIAFRDRDHGPGQDAPLRPWIEGQLALAGIDIDGGPIRLLCYPRIFGYVFNPLTVWFCHHRRGRLAALLWEVNNTFGERHCYLIPVEGDAGTVVRQECDKLFYVSPFIAVGGRYRFRVTMPAGDLSLSILQHDSEGGPLLHASFDGRRAPLDDRTLAKCLLRYPLLTLKIMAGIHVEALRLWWKGIPLIHRPPPPAQPVTIVAPNS